MYSNGHYPVVVASENADDKIYGEVYRLHNLKQVFDRLDSYEGFKQTNTEASLFLREKKEIVLSDQEKIIRAWIYLFNRPVNNLLRISSGDYLQFFEKG